MLNNQAANQSNKPYERNTPVTTPTYKRLLLCGSQSCTKARPEERSGVVKEPYMLGTATTHISPKRANIGTGKVASPTEATSIH